MYLLVLQQELPQLVEEVPVSKRDRGCFEHGGAFLNFSLEVRNLIDDRFDNRMCQPQQFARQVFRLRFTGLCVLGGWMKAMICGVKAGTRDALFGRIVEMQTKSGPVSGG